MTTKSFDANRRKKVYPAIRKSPVIRFESDTPCGDPISEVTILGTVSVLIDPIVYFGISDSGDSGSSGREVLPNP
jgi:hypothetical protein